MSTKVIEVKQKYEKLHPSAVLYKKAKEKAYKAFEASSTNLPAAKDAREALLRSYQAAEDASEAAEDVWKKAGSPPLEPVRIELIIIIQNAINKMEAMGCEFINMVLKEKGDGAYLFFKCPADGAGNAITRSNKKSRRSRTRKN